MIRTPGSCVSITMRSIVIQPGDHPRMQLDGRFDRGLGVKLRRVGDLEQHVLHHIAARTACGIGKALPLEEHVVKAPGPGGQRRRA